MPTPTVTPTITNSPDLSRYMHTDTRGDRSSVLPDVNLTLLALELGISRSHLSKVVNGMRPGRDLLFRMAGLLGGSVEDVDEWLAYVAKRRKRKQKQKKED